MKIVQNIKIHDYELIVRQNENASLHHFEFISYNQCIKLNSFDPQYSTKINYQINFPSNHNLDHLINDLIELKESINYFKEIIIGYGYTIE